MNPDTTLVFTNLSLGHFCITSLWRHAQMYLEKTTSDMYDDLYEFVDALCIFIIVNFERLK